MLLEAFVVTAGVAGLGGYYTFQKFNDLVAMSHRCDHAASDVDVQTRQRYDLIPALVKTVKGYSAHEDQIIQHLMTARAAAMRAASFEEKARAEMVLDKQLGQFMTLIEAYPEVKASAHFTELSAEIMDVEHKIAAARRFSNMAATEYNTSLQQFPANLIAQRFGFATRRVYSNGMERAQIEEGPSYSF